MEYLSVESLDRLFDLFSVLYGKKERKKERRSGKLLKEGQITIKTSKQTIELFYCRSNCILKF